jgi:hypothetical protein
MPFEYSADPVRRRLIVRGTDPIDFAQVLQLLERQAGERAWSYGTLEDMRGVTWIPSADEIRAYLARTRELSRERGPRGPVAFVISDNQALFGMVRMYSVLAEVERLDAHIELFTSVAEAAAWLDREGR